MATDLQIKQLRSSEFASTDPLPQARASSAAQTSTPSGPVDAERTAKPPTRSRRLHVAVSTMHMILAVVPFSVTIWQLVMH